MSPMMIKLRFLHAFSGRHPFPASFPKMMPVGNYVTVDGHVIDAFAFVRQGSGNNLNWICGHDQARLPHGYAFRQSTDHVSSRAHVGYK